MFEEEWTKWWQKSDMIRRILVIKSLQKSLLQISFQVERIRAFILCCVLLDVSLKSLSILKKFQKPFDTPGCIGIWRILTTWKPFSVPLSDWRVAVPNLNLPFWSARLKLNRGIFQTKFNTSRNIYGHVIKPCLL